MTLLDTQNANLPGLNVPVFQLFFDGACEPKNPGGACVSAYVLIDPNGVGVCSSTFQPARPTNTNNTAEWLSLLAGVLEAGSQASAGANAHTPIDTSKGISLAIRGDSLLVINQLNGIWACRAPNLHEIRKLVLAELDQPFIRSWSATWIPREENTVADELTRKTYREFTGSDMPVRERRGK